MCLLRIYKHPFLKNLKVSTLYVINLYLGGPKLCYNLSNIPRIINPLVRVINKRGDYHVKKTTEDCLGGNADLYYGCTVHDVFCC